MATPRTPARRATPLHRGNLKTNAAEVPSIKRGARQGGVCRFVCRCEISGLTFFHLSPSTGVMLLDRFLVQRGFKLNSDFAAWLGCDAIAPSYSPSLTRRKLGHSMLASQSTPPWGSEGVRQETTRLPHLMTTLARALVGKAEFCHREVGGQTAGSQAQLSASPAKAA